MPPGALAVREVALRIAPMGATVELLTLPAGSGGVDTLEPGVARAVGLSDRPTPRAAAERLGVGCVLAASVGTAAQLLQAPIETPVPVRLLAEMGQVGVGPPIGGAALALATDPGVGGGPAAEVPPGAREGRRRGPAGPGRGEGALLPRPADEICVGAAVGAFPPVHLRDAVVARPVAGIAETSLVGRAVGGGPGAHLALVPGDAGTIRAGAAILAMIVGLPATLTPAVGAAPRDVAAVLAKTMGLGATIGRTAVGRALVAPALVAVVTCDRNTAQALAVRGPAAGEEAAVGAGDLLGSVAARRNAQHALHPVVA